jgi:hypothetical protein
VAGCGYTNEEIGRVTRLAAAARFPARIRVVVAHADKGLASAAALARDGLDTFENISYHQRRLHQLGVLEADDRTETPRRRRYGLTGFGEELAEALTRFASGRTDGDGRA